MKIGRSTGVLDPAFGVGGVVEYRLADLRADGDAIYIITRAEEPPRLLRLDGMTGGEVYSVDRPVLAGTGIEGEGSLTVDGDTVFVLDLRHGEDGQMNVRSYQASDGAFVQQYPVGAIEEGPTGAGGKIVVGGGTITTAVNPSGGPWGASDILHFRQINIATGTVLGDEVSEQELHIGIAATRNDRMLWRGWNVISGEGVLREAFGTFELTEQAFASGVDFPPRLFSTEEYLYLSTSRTVGEDESVSRIERRSLETGELDPAFADGGVLEGEVGEPIGYAIADDESLFIQRRESLGGGDFLFSVERRTLPDGSL
jgi:hypothetical protein